MGLHQDKDESERSLAAGLPVVSVSLGDTARFLFGGCGGATRWRRVSLESGDAFVFGGPRACAITACRASCPAPRRRSSGSTGGST